MGKRRYPQTKGRVKQTASASPSDEKLQREGRQDRTADPRKQKAAVAVDKLRELARSDDPK
jgi:hypothetical protein